MDKTGEYQGFPPEKFLPHSAENFCRGILCCCSIFGYGKVWIRSGGGGGRGRVSRFSVDFFCLAVPKIFAGETLCAEFQKDSGSKKFVNRRGGVSRFSVEFLSCSAENIRR